ncbi:hypothetical protein HanPSC8_Chr15g0662731 [Helianthus annuus]|nr:hypothetical protein HanPSC8_Chr16g0742101 [Helianthus annuus]KAJ0831067.1 hypothetical protein HanPSC8_Chr15g0662731 [Helianthus annuus]
MRSCLSLQWVSSFNNSPNTVSSRAGSTGGSRMCTGAIAFPSSFKIMLFASCLIADVTFCKGVKPFLPRASGASTNHGSFSSTSDTIFRNKRFDIRNLCRKISSLYFGSSTK